MTDWKHSFERLSKHEYVACVVHPKKVVCYKTMEKSHDKVRGLVCLLFPIIRC